MRPLLLSLMVLASSTAGAATTFVTPQEGAQLFGLTLVEIETDVARVDRVELYVDGVLAGAARTAPYRLAYDFGDDMRSRSLTAKVWSEGFAKFEEATMLSAALSMNESVTVDLVEVPLRVRASHVLRPVDLRVVENGVEQEIRDVTMERPPAHFAFIVDRSLSMRDGRLEAALGAVEQGLAGLRTGDTASVVLFNHHVERPVAITRGKPLAIDASTPSGGTSLRDAIASVASPRRTYAIVITDGGDRNSALPEEEALRRISGTKTVVNAIVTGDAHGRFLERAASNTGGTVVKARKDRIAAALAALLADINSRHLLVYQSSASNSGWRHIDVRPRRRGVDVISARKGYFSE